MELEYFVIGRRSRWRANALFCKQVAKNSKKNNNNRRSTNHKFENLKRK